MKTTSYSVLHYQYNQVSAITLLNLMKQKSGSISYMFIDSGVLVLLNWYSDHYTLL